MEHLKTSIPCVQTNRLTKAFGSQEALKEASITVEKGEIYGILGPNGAGKTTLLKLIAGLLIPTAGTVQVLGMGMDIAHSHNNDHAQVLRQIGSLIETPIFYEHLSAAENLSIHLAYMETDGNIAQALHLVGLDNVGEKPVSQYSLGMRQRLAIARAMVHKPSVLLLDEPINGLDPIAIREMRELFTSLANQGITLLLSSHILSEVEQTATRVAVLAGGRVVMEAEMEALKREHPQDLEAYLINSMNGGISLC